MKALVAFPSTATFAQQAALAFYERDSLAAYYTSYWHRPDGAIAKLMLRFPGVGPRLIQQLGRRSISALPASAIESRPLWEILRTVADKVGANPPLVDRIWDHMSREFTTSAGRRIRHDVDLIYAYEYTALEAFESAAKQKLPRILDFPSLDSRQFENLQRREKERFPELRSPFEAYFDARFESRQKRRDRERSLADVIITNSSVTRESHVRAGAPAERTFAVPYGAPPVIDSIKPRDISGPLNVVWAGTFSLRKAAHLFIDAWRAFSSRSDAVADVYGAIALPDRLREPASRNLNFHGSVIRSVLFDAFERADVLIFPTLSDGFGMVVTEAFSRGLPVITTDQAGASDLVKHGNNGLVIPAGDVGEIQRALQWCDDNRDALRAMRAAALKTAREWQWSHYRSALVEAVNTGLERAGYSLPAIDVRIPQ